MRHNPLKNKGNKASTFLAVLTRQNDNKVIRIRIAASTLTCDLYGTSTQNQLFIWTPDKEIK